MKIIYYDGNIDELISNPKFNKLIGRQPSNTLKIVRNNNGITQVQKDITTNADFILTTVPEVVDLLKERVGLDNLELMQDGELRMFQDWTDKELRLAHNFTKMIWCGVFELKGRNE